MSVNEIIAVQELPLEPINEGHYIFDKVTRQHVTINNHGLHKYPAKFIPQLPQWGLSYDPSDQLKVVLDPFCGSGTTLVEAGLKGLSCYGYDVNPLAVIITRAKTANLLHLVDAPETIISRLVKKAAALVPEFLQELDHNADQLGLHTTWSFWFRSPEMAQLLSLKSAIDELGESDDPQLAMFLLACLSAIAKSASYLNEDQIKVRFDHNKKLQNPFEVFAQLAVSAIRTQQTLSRRFVECGSEFSVEAGTAGHLSLMDNSVDRIITSPPYINAVDYTMAHKYNLFILGLIEPGDFKNHCREYIGITERAVKAADLTRIPETDFEIVDYEIQRLWRLDTPVARNRAFVVAQYFNGMAASIREMHRVLRVGGKVILVIGHQNRICGFNIETAAILEHIAEKIGFETPLRFFHHLSNRSSMRLNRSSTGGEVKYEVVYVFQKAV